MVRRTIIPKPVAAPKEFAILASLFKLLTGSSRRRKRYARGQRTPKRIVGRAYVVDGDTIRVEGESIRLHGIDAPELDQIAEDLFGNWYSHGELVKEILENEIGGKQVDVKIVGRGKYGRLLGIVSHDGMDVNEWLVRNGHAIAAYGDTYRRAENRANRERLGMWGDRTMFDPRDWRQRNR